jgi:hypothetical protein
MSSPTPPGSRGSTASPARACTQSSRPRGDPGMQQRLPKRVKRARRARCLPSPQLHPRSRGSHERSGRPSPHTCACRLRRQSNPDDDGPAGRSQARRVFGRRRRASASMTCPVARFATRVRCSRRLIILASVGGSSLSCSSSAPRVRCAIIRRRLRCASVMSPPNRRSGRPDARGRRRRRPAKDAGGDETQRCPLQIRIGPSRARH